MQDSDLFYEELQLIYFQSKDGPKPLKFLVLQPYHCQTQL